MKACLTLRGNLLFNWRRLHLRAQTLPPTDTPAPALLPVRIVEAAPSPVPAPPPVSRSAPASTIEIDINGARVRVRGPVDEASLRSVLRSLASAG